MGKHRYASSVLGLLVAGALFLVGCGQGGDGPTPGGTVTPPPTSIPPSSSPSSPRPSLTPTGQPQPTGTISGTKKPGQLTVRGQVKDGVEGGCLLLRTDDGVEYLLLGGDRTVIAGGGRLEVVGRAEPGLMTTCQQGIPLQVEQVRRI